MTMFLQLMDKTVFMDNRKRREKRELAKEGNICSYKDINDGDKSASLATSVCHQQDFSLWCCLLFGVNALNYALQQHDKWGHHLHQ